MSLAAAGAYGAANGLASLLGGQGGVDRNPDTSLYALSPQQQALQHMMQNRAMMGNIGDTGFGAAVKQGKSQLGAFLQRQGIAQDSGFGMAGMGNMIANAAATDAQNRHTRLMDIANLSPAFGTASAYQGRHNMWQADPTGQYTGNPQSRNYMFNRQY